MRLFKKNPNKSSSGNTPTESVRVNASADSLIPSLSNLFVDRPESETYVQSPQDAAEERVLPKPSGGNRTHSGGVQFDSPVSLMQTEDLDDDGLGLADRTGRSIDSEPVSMSGTISSLTEQPKSSKSTESLASASAKTQSPDETFEVAGCDDDAFMIEEATRRDMSLQTSAADLETATVLFRKRDKSKKQESVDMSAEEILRTQRWGRTQKMLPGTPARRLRKGKRPPPLVSQLALPSNSPTASHKNVFGNDGGFVTDGFKITADGILNKPAADLRRDETKTLRGASVFDSIQMRSLNEFKKGPTIGAGAAGRVYLALHQPSSLAVAMKTVNVFDKGLRSQLMKELLTLSRHISRYLVRFYGAFYDGSGAVHIALEFMDRGCLNSFVKKNGPIPEHVVRVIAVDCLRGLRFLHKHHVLHRDFKTANILLSREQSCAKISDFGLARDLNQGKSVVNTFVGTIAYMSPERLQSSEYTYASDIWALGVSLAECVMGKYPFAKPQHYFEYIDATLEGNLFDQGSKELESISEDAKSFILLCADSDPKKRPTAEQLLQHAWLKGFSPDREAFGEWLDFVSSRETPKKADNA